jgi:biopolymer transport protein ExbD
MKLVKHKRVEEVVELNITAFLNLMVILVPFLLITAVFSRITILELNLPAKDALASQRDTVKLQLELVIRPESFEIRDATLGRIKSISRNDGEHWEAFTDTLIEIKKRFPEELNISLLLDPRVNYKTLIQVMDRVRSTDIVQLMNLETIELFPNISIGDAPEREDKSIDSLGYGNIQDPSQ